MRYLDVFPWNGNELVEKTYNCNPNYIIWDNPVKNQFEKDRCVVFFSSNSLYFPNDPAAFQKKVIEQNYYEWMHISRIKSVRRRFKRIIFLRDVYKQWYSLGINSQLSSMDSVIEMLRKETDGYRLTVCGSSSGGYAAIVVGNALDAEIIICNSPQFDLTIDKDYFANLLDADVTDIYINIRRQLIDSSDKIFCIIPSEAESDRKQLALIKDIGINRLYIQSTEHGKTIAALCYPHLLTMSFEEIRRFFETHDKVYTREQIARELLDSKEFILNKLVQKAKKMRNKLLL